MYVDLIRDVERIKEERFSEHYLTGRSHDVVRLAIEQGRAELDGVYLRDPEGNIVEIQSWKK